MAISMNFNFLLRKVDFSEKFGSSCFCPQKHEVEEKVISLKILPFTCEMRGYKKRCDEFKE